MRAGGRRVCNLHSRRWPMGSLRSYTSKFTGTQHILHLRGPGNPGLWSSPRPGGGDGQEFANAVGDASRQVATRRVRLQRRGWTRRYSRAASATKDWIAHSPRAHWILTRRQSRPDIRAVSVTRGSVGVRRLRLGPADIRERMSMRPPWRLARRGGRSMASLGRGVPWEPLAGAPAKQENHTPVGGATPRSAVPRSRRRWHQAKAVNQAPAQPAFLTSRLLRATAPGKNCGLGVTRPHHQGHEQRADHRQDDEQAPPPALALLLHHHERDRQPGLLLLREAGLVEVPDRGFHLERCLVAPRDQLQDLVQIRRREPHLVQRLEIRVSFLEVS